MKRPIPIIGILLLATVLSGSCRQLPAEDKGRTTFVLSDSMMKNIRIDTARLVRDEKIVIPAAAVIFDNSKNYVLVFRDKFNIAIREVEVIKTVGTVTYLAAGLKENENVISKNQLPIYNALKD
ncbi:hypothetical protein [Chitinophaga sp. 212800010-3]|uniref:hypothetical protein n=1 Tax=unclassified Chitinophaga TaxID=2619133 RepID=UPI002DF144A5|nr:hypothetical protein [Chitinophaga sp. 212800010-3]